MDNTCPTTALTALYTNVAPPTARQTSSTPSRPPSGGNSDNSGHRNKNNNKNRNGDHGDGNNDGNNNNNSGDRSQTTASNGRTGTPWPTYGHLWQEHMTVCPGPVPTGQQRPHAFMVTSGPYPSPGFLPGQQ
jgi:hypothetical protein